MGKGMRISKKEKTKYAIECARLRHQSKKLTKKLTERARPNAEAEAEMEFSEGGGKRFFGCYLLTSLSPRYKGHSYIGFTVNPKRRIRQHNGEITSGALTTKKKRPWEMVLCIHGFPTNVAALQFEWAWQHPRESIAVREAASSFKTLGGLANKIKLALTMLTLHTWQSMDLTVSFFSTKYMKHTAGSPSLPHQMKIHYCSMDELPCYWHGDDPYCHDDDEYDLDPHATSDSGNLHDDRQESSRDDSLLLEMNHSAIDISSCTIPNATENIGTLEQTSIGGFLERESSSLMDNGILGEHIHSYQQLQLGEEIPTADDEHLQSIYQFPTDVGDMNEQLQHTEEICSQQLSGSFTSSELAQEQHIEPFDRTVERESSSRVTCVSLAESFAKKKDLTCKLIDEITAERSRPQKEQSPSRVAGSCFGRSSVDGIEVIDLFTPSPDCRIVACSKKRRVAANDCPDIIDLTRSPLFVQL